MSVSLNSLPIQEFSPSESLPPGSTPESEYILVVEDNRDLNQAICEILLSHDYAVKSASNGKDALEQISEQKPEVILCDIKMPKMDGYTLLKHARANPELRSLPFIFLTARTDPADQRQALEIGIEDYLTKPIDEEDLILAIQNALRRRQVVEEEMQDEMELLRREIVGILQHEFRTPLTFVLGYAQYLEDILDGEIDSEDLRIAIKGILEGGERLHRLIEGFLLLAELQNKTIEPDDMKHVSVTDLLNEVTQDAQKQLSEANITIVVADVKDIWITCEHMLIVEALKRLVDNSIRYRRPDSRQVHLSVKKIADQYIGLSVQDEGAGIAKVDLDAISQAFKQGNRSERTEPGVGISLTMIQHIARLHGGQLQIESAEGVGTTCTLWIPVV